MVVVVVVVVVGGGGVVVVVVVGGGVVVVAVVVGGICGELNGFVCGVAGETEANGLLAVVNGIVGVGGGGPCDDGGSCDDGGDLVVAKRFLTCFCGVHEGVGPITGGTKGCWGGPAIEW